MCDDVLCISLYIHIYRLDIEKREGKHNQYQVNKHLGKIREKTQPGVIKKSIGKCSENPVSVYFLLSEQIGL